MKMKREEGPIASHYFHPFFFSLLLLASSLHKTFSMDHEKNVLKSVIRTHTIVLLVMENLCTKKCLIFCCCCFRILPILLSELIRGRYPSLMNKRNWMNGNILFMQNICQQSQKNIDCVLLLPLLLQYWNKIPALLALPTAPSTK